MNGIARVGLATIVSVGAVGLGGCGIGVYSKDARAGFMINEATRSAWELLLAEKSRASQTIVVNAPAVTREETKRASTYAFEKQVDRNSNGKFDGIQELEGYNRESFRAEERMWFGAEFEGYEGRRLTFSIENEQAGETKELMSMTIPMNYIRQHQPARFAKPGNYRGIWSIDGVQKAAYRIRVGSANGPCNIYHRKFGGIIVGAFNYVEDFNNNGRLDYPEEYIGMKDAFEPGEKINVRLNSAKRISDLSYKLVNQEGEISDSFSLKEENLKDSYGINRLYNAEGADKELPSGEYHAVWYSGDEMVAKWEFNIK